MAAIHTVAGSGLTYARLEVTTHTVAGGGLTYARLEVPPDKQPCLLSSAPSY